MLDARIPRPAIVIREPAGAQAESSTCLPLSLSRINGLPLTISITVPGVSTVLDDMLAQHPVRPALETATASRCLPSPDHP